MPVYSELKLEAKGDLRRIISFKDVKRVVLISAEKV